MKTYDETYERIMVKKAIAEKENKARNKKTVTYVTTVLCLCVCFVAVFAISKFRVNIRLNDNEVSDAFHYDSSTNSSKYDEKFYGALTQNPSKKTSADSNKNKTSKASTTVTNNDSKTKEAQTEQNNSTTIFAQLTTAYGYVTPEWRKKEIEEHRINMVKSAMRGVPKEDVKRINTDKSYIVSMYGKNGEDEQGNEYYLMHLDGDDFYYEVEIDAAGEKVYSSVRKNKNTDVIYAFK